MKIYITFTKTKIVAVVAFLVVAIAVATQISAVGNKVKNGETQDDRTLYLSQLGFNQPKLINSKDIVIPTEFSDVYKNYNSLQIEAGFDLLKYKGRSATVYSYEDKKTGKIINLMVVDGEIIGGDIMQPNLNGTMLPLK